MRPESGFVHDMRCAASKALCKSGCYINEQCMNHVIYADDICLLAPSAIGLRQMLDVCCNFSICNDIMFNPVKSVCIAFQPKKSKLFCPNVTLDNNFLKYLGRTKYLGFMFNSNGQDDEDMLRQMLDIYIFVQTSYFVLFIIVLLMLN